MAGATTSIGLEIKVVDGNTVNHEADFRLRLQERVKNEEKGITNFEFVNFNYGSYVGKTSDEILGIIYPISIDDGTYFPHRTDSNGSLTVTGTRNWHKSDTVYRIVAYSPTDELIGGITTVF